MERPEHRLLLETLARLRSLLAKKAVVRRVKKAGQIEALRALVAQFTQEYNPTLDEEQSRALRLGIPTRLRAVHVSLELPELSAAEVKALHFRSTNKATVDSGLARQAFRLLDSLRDLIAPPPAPGDDPSATLTMAPSHPERPAEPTEVLWPRISGPRRAEVDEEVSIEAWYALQPGEDADRSLTAAVIAGQVAVDVSAEVTGALVLESPAHRTLTGAAGKRPGGVTFRCRAVREGAGQVHVTFRVKGDECTLTHTLAVHAIGQLTDRLRASDEHRGQLTRGLPSPDLTLTARALDHGLDVQLCDPTGELFVDGITPLDRTTAAILRQWVDEGWRLSQQQPSQARERQLGTIGANLARKMLAPSFIDALRSHPAGHLRICCDDPSLPWEMLRLGGPDDRPLAEAAAVARYPLRGRWGRRHRPGEAVLVVAKDAGAAAEQAAIAALGMGSVTALDTAAALVDRLASAAPIGVLHFACHGDARLERSGSQRLILRDGDLIPAVVLADPDASPLAGALVFINACRAAAGDRVEPGLVGHHAWAEAFLAAGAAAVIAPVCAVSDAEASAFAVAVYAGLCDGHPVDEAVRRARVGRAAAEPGRFERLAYVLYAPPGVRVGQHRESP